MDDVQRRILEMAERYAEPDAVPRIQAERMIRELQDTDPQLLGRWLITQAPSILTTLILRIQNQRRTRGRELAKYETIEKNLNFIEETGTNIFSWKFTVDEEGNRRSLGSMRGADLVFVAENSYEKPAQTEMAMAAFLRAVAREVKNRTVDEVYTQEKLERQMRSFLERGGGEPTRKSA